MTIGIRMAGERLSMWIVYDHPLDYPDVFIARRFEIGAPDEGDEGVIRTDDTIVSPHLYIVREQLAVMGLDVLRRFAGDDPNIVEAWL